MWSKWMIISINNVSEFNVEFTQFQCEKSLVHVSACSFAVSQASDLALLVGYVA